MMRTGLFRTHARSISIDRHPSGTTTGREGHVAGSPGPSRIRVDDRADRQVARGIDADRHLLERQRRLLLAAEREDLDLGPGLTGGVGERVVTSPRAKS